MYTPDQLRCGGQELLLLLQGLADAERDLSDDRADAGRQLERVKAIDAETGEIVGATFEGEHVVEE